MEFTQYADFPAHDTVRSLGHAVEQDGLQSPPLRAVARMANCSPSTLINWFGSKASLHRRTLIALGCRWRSDLYAELIPDDPPALLRARLRVAYDELARADPALAEVLDELAEAERDLVVRHLRLTYGLPDDWLDSEAVAILHALACRLWDERAHPDRAEARGLLWRTAEALLGLSPRSSGPPEGGVGVGSSGVVRGADCARRAAELAAAAQAAQEPRITIIHTQAVPGGVERLGSGDVGELPRAG